MLFVDFVRLVKNTTHTKNIQQIKNNLTLEKLCEINDNGESLLHLAIKANNLMAMKLILECGANINLKKEGFDYPVAYAVLNRRYEAVQFLIEHGCELKQDDNYSCIYAASMRCKKTLELLLKSGANVSVKDYDGCNAARWAAQENALNCMRLLLKYHCPINIVDNYDQTPLYVAASENHLLMVQLLLKHGADVDLTGDVTPFGIACSFGFFEICTVLLKAGANVNFKDKEGRTPLFYAFVKQDINSITFLLNHGASSDVVDQYGISIKDLRNEKIRLKLYKELF